MSEATILTFNEVRLQLRVSANTLRGILLRKELPAVKVGATWRVKPADLESYLCPSTSVDPIGISASTSTDRSSEEPPTRPVRLRPNLSKARSEKRPSEPSSWEVALNENRSHSAKSRTAGSRRT